MEMEVNTEPLVQQLARLYADEWNRQMSAIEPGTIEPVPDDTPNFLPAGVEVSCNIVDSPSGWFVETIISIGGKTIVQKSPLNLPELEITDG